MRDLETKLEVDVACMGQFLYAEAKMQMQTRAENLTPLQMAKEYWLKFPRAAGNPDVDSGVKHALSLVDAVRRLFDLQVAEALSEAEEPAAASKKASGGGEPS